MIWGATARRETSTTPPSEAANQVQARRPKRASADGERWCYSFYEDQEEYDKLGSAAALHRLLAR